jgi:hydrogenase nickel incorporation protein HypB
MCGHCGCGSEAKATALNLQTGEEIAMESRAHDHDHQRAHEHEHAHDHAHGHEHEHVHADGSRHSHPHRSDDAPGADLLTLQTRILAKNDAFAEKNRAWFRGREILALNLVSSPGSGKTTLLERTIKDLKDELKLFVVEGDQATARDGERIRVAGAAAVQINTGSGCHLEADMLGRALQHLKPGAGSIVMIENVGNLVCPALFDLGERCKVVIFSVTEGEDKPLKYPTMFGAAAIMILNKIDLLPYVEFDVARAIANARQINPDIAVLRLSGRTGEGFEAWYDWLRKEVDALRDAAFA